MLMKRGVHVIGDLYGCALEKFVQEKAAVADFEKHITEKINATGLHCLGVVSHFFGPAALTSAFILSESHLTFHTWPEDAYVSLDVFTCDLNQVNGEKAEAIFDYLAEEVFHSKNIEKQIIRR